MAHLTVLHTVHERTWEHHRYGYPVLSRRSRGLSIGVNLNPDKLCNFDCVYCCVDRTPGERSPDPTDRRIDLDVLRVELESLLREAAGGQIFDKPPFDQTPPELRRLSDVAFSGDGEPTACLQFPQAARVVVDALRAVGASHTPVVLITNATLLTRPAVVDTLAYLDRHHLRVWAKLDAGTDAYYRTVDRSSVPFERVLENLRLTGRIRPIWIQSLFVRLHGRPPPPAEIDAYVARLIELRAGGCQIASVQVCTVARRPAEPFVTPLTDAELDRITQRIRLAGIAAEPFYGPD
ncbi:MAG: radical SAM protein [Tepidisphaerales bacterium]